MSSKTMWFSGGSSLEPRPSIKAARVARSARVCSPVAHTNKQAPASSMLATLSLEVFWLATLQPYCPAPCGNSRATAAMLNASPHAALKSQGFSHHITGKQKTPQTCFCTRLSESSSVSDHSPHSMARDALKQLSCLLPGSCRTTTMAQL